MASISDAAANSSDIIPKTNIEVLNQEIWEDEAMYRIRAGKRVHYINFTIPVHPNPVFDHLTLCRSYLLIPKLPPFPNSDWTTMQVVVGGHGDDIESTISYEPLDQVQSPWHPQHIEVLSLKRISSYKPRVDEVEFEGRTAIAKIAILKQWIPQIEHETKVYEIIANNQCPDT